ncbi:MAG TPA: hypothetical protein VGB87_15265, partial [Vicinamibacteria bacterium]
MSNLFGGIGWRRSFGRIVNTSRDALAFGEPGRRGAALGLAGAIAAASALVLCTRVAPGAVNPVLFLVTLLRLVQALAWALVLQLLFTLGRRRPSLLTTLALTLAIALLLELLGLPLAGVLLLVAPAVLFPPLLCAGLSTLVASRGAHTPRSRRVAAAAAALVGGLGCLLAAHAFFRDGDVVAAPTSAGLRAAHLPDPLAAPDPSRPGPHGVRRLTYGSGRDRWRPEFSQRANLVTSPVDGSRLVEGWSGFSGWSRTRFWGFDVHGLPLQGRVFCPDAEGPFPLVLVVHGSHAMEDFSDGGYDYLGTLLASRGFVVVSVDENAINTSDADGAFFPLVDGRLRGEVDLRAWLLLEHLRLWREWSRTPGHVFERKADLGRVALVGHSKGGEAVAVAAAFNRLHASPDDSRVAFDYGFGIRAVVGIAPTDGLYEPGGRPTRLTDVSYLALHGTHDMDVQSFVGTRQFSRVAFSDCSDCVKGVVSVYGANHGQFNTVWGRTDYSRLRTHLQNRRPLLSGEEQRRIASVYLSSFFETTLRQDRRYLPFLRDARAGRGWLPSTVLVTDFQDATTRALCDFEEDVDPGTTTLPGGGLHGENLALWREGQARIKWGSRGTRAVFLGWDRESSTGVPSYTVTLPGDGPALDDRAVLVFSAADTGERPPAGARQPSARAARHRASASDPIDFSVELTDRRGTAIRLALGEFSYVQPLLRVPVAKAAVLTDAPPSEPLYQSLELPLSAFVRANPAFAPSALRTLRFVFDRTPAGVLSLDDIGFRP